MGKKKRKDEVTVKFVSNSAVDVTGSAILVSYKNNDYLLEFGAVQGFGGTIEKEYALNYQYSRNLNIDNLKCILVEKQVLKNRICMMLQSSVLTWCVINNVKYHSFDPKLKFKYTKTKLNTKKKEHKKESVKYASNILLNLGYSLDYFNTFKKK